MTKIEFVELCNRYGIHPSIALENEDIEAALLSRDYDKVEEILATQF